MAEAVYQRAADDNRLILAAALTTGEVYQLPNGRAAVYKGQNGRAVGDTETFADTGKYTVVKTATQVWLDGDPIWWDHSAGAATVLEPIGAGDRDFYLGTAVGNAASADTTGSVDLNKQVNWIIDSSRDNGDSAIIKTVVGSTTVEVPQIYNRGGMIYMQFGTTAEAQKVDWLSGRSFVVGSNWIVDMLLEVQTSPDNAAVDIDIGVATSSHDTDLEAVTALATFHLDGGDNNIDVQSDDSGTDVGPTDTTTDWTEGTPFRMRIDGRTLSDLKYYLEGSETNSGTANLGTFTAAVGPLFAIIHAEKTSDDSPLAFRARIRVRTMEQSSDGTT